MSIVIPQNVIKALSLFAPKADVRYYLNGICIEAGPKGVFAIATDDHTLAAAQLSDESMPELQVIIPQSIIDTLMKVKKTPSFSLTIDGDTLTFVSPSHERFMCKKVDGRYPDWRRVIARVDVLNFEAVFNPEYLMRVQKAGAIFGRPYTFVKPNGMNVGYASLDNDDKVGAWVMPMRQDPKKWASGPVWSI